MGIQYSPLSSSSSSCSHSSCTGLQIEPQVGGGGWPRRRWWWWLERESGEKGSFITSWNMCPFNTLFTKWPTMILYCCVAGELKKGTEETTKTINYTTPMCKSPCRTINFNLIKVVGTIQLFYSLQLVRWKQIATHDGRGWQRSKWGWGWNLRWPLWRSIYQISYEESIVVGFMIFLSLLIQL